MINARYKTVAYTFHIDRRVRIPAYETVYNLHDATDRTIANSAKPAANYFCIIQDNGKLLRTGGSEIIPSSVSARKTRPYPDCKSSVTRCNLVTSTTS